MAWHQVCRSDRMPALSNKDLRQKVKDNCRRKVKSSDGNPTLLAWLLKSEELIENALDINPSPVCTYTTAVQHLLNGSDAPRVTPAAVQDTPVPDTVSPV